jgi:hypothetical protein
MSAPYFSGVGDAAEGDYITKYGERSGKTSGVVQEIRSVKGRPDLGLIVSDMVQLPGDSGGPWVKSGPTLIGIGSSGNQERSGGTAGSQAQPIGAVISLIRNTAGIWGVGFKVWVDR